MVYQFPFMLQKQLISTLFCYRERISLTLAAYFYRLMLYTFVCISGWGFYQGSELDVELNVSQ